MEERAVVRARVYELRDGVAVARPRVCRLCGAAHDLGVLPRAGTVGEKALPLLRDFGLRA
jgi:hypothetical protein